MKKFYTILSLIIAPLTQLQAQAPHALGSTSILSKMKYFMITIQNCMIGLLPCGIKFKFEDILKIKCGLDQFIEHGTIVWYLRKRSQL